MIRPFETAIVAFALFAVQARGQTLSSNAAPVPTGTAPTITEEVNSKAWFFSASAYTYIVPDSREYVQPTFSADHDWLHLEARYNYENLETASAWIGYNFSGGKKLAWEFTPMLGGVFGNTTGIAPGYKGSLSWWKLELYSEGEFAIDTGDSSSSFFYTWSELTCSPTDWFRFGLVAQRTRLHQSDLDIQRGFLVGFSYKNVDFTTYIFNVGWTDPTVVLALGVEF
jgi:hypothetical protein